MDFIINQWNGNHFPLMAVYNRWDYYDNGEKSKHIIQVYKHILDNLEGDVDFKDTKVKMVGEFISYSSSIEALEQMKKEFGY